LTLLDAYALVALLADEPAADDVESLLRAGDCGIVNFNLAEAIDVTQRVHHLSPDEVRALVEPLLGGVLTLVMPAETHTWRAAEIRVRHYDRRTRPLSLADCFLLAAATVDDRIATADPPLAQTARDEDVRLIGLPDRAGRTP